MLLEYSRNIYSTFLPNDCPTEPTRLVITPLQDCGGSYLGKADNDHIIVVDKLDDEDEYGCEDSGYYPNDWVDEGPTIADVATVCHELGHQKQAETFSPEKLRIGEPEILSNLGPNFTDEDLIRQLTRVWQKKYPLDLVQALIEGPAVMIEMDILKMISNTPTHPERRDANVFLRSERPSMRRELNAWMNGEGPFDSYSIGWDLTKQIARRVGREKVITAMGEIDYRQLAGYVPTVTEYQRMKANPLRTIPGLEIFLPNKTKRRRSVALLPKINCPATI